MKLTVGLTSLLLLVLVFGTKQSTMHVKSLVAQGCPPCSVTNTTERTLNRTETPNALCTPATVTVYPSRKMKQSNSMHSEINYHHH